MLGSPEESKSFVADIQVFGTQANENLSYSGPVVSIDVEDKESEMCFVMTDDVVKRLIADKKLRFKFNVKKL